MDTTIWISLGGLAATVAVSAIGFYYTHKSQRTPIRQELYKLQVECLSAFVVQSTRMQQLAAAFTSGSVTFTSGGEEDMAWESLNDEILEITQRAGLVLPSAAYSTLTAYRAAQRDFEDALMAGTNLRAALQAMQGAFASVFMVGREVLGADSLSRETIRLHGVEGYESMNRIGSTAFGQVIQSLWRHGQPTNSKG